MLKKIKNKLLNQFSRNEVDDPKDGKEEEMNDINVQSPEEYEKYREKLHRVLSKANKIKLDPTLGGETSKARMEKWYQLKGFDLGKDYLRLDLQNKSGTLSNIKEIRYNFTEISDDTGEMKVWIYGEPYRCYRMYIPCKESDN